MLGWMLCVACPWCLRWGGHDGVELDFGGLRQTSALLSCLNTDETCRGLEISHQRLGIPAVVRLKVGMQIL